MDESAPLVFDNTNANLDSSMRDHIRPAFRTDQIHQPAKASKLQQRQAIEEQEELLSKQREALELSVELEATNAKIYYLKRAEKNMYDPIPFGSDPAHTSVLGAEASAAAQDDELDSFVPFLGNTSVVKPKASATHVNFPLCNPDHSRPLSHPRPTSNAWPQAQHISMHSLPYDDSDIPPLPTQPSYPTQPPARPAASSAQGAQCTAPQPFNPSQPPTRPAGMQPQPTAPQPQP